MGTWALCVLLYAVIKGMREGIKKKAMTKSSIPEILFFYTLVAFLLQIPFARDIFKLEPVQYLMIFGKAFIIFIAWICAFNAISKIDVSLYSVLDLSRMLFTIALSVIILNETLGIRQYIGLAVILAGLLLVNLKREQSDTKTKPIAVILILISCFFNAVSGVLDKIYLRRMSTAQLQFWYMFFLTVLFLAYVIITRTKIEWKTLRTNYWIPLLGLIFIIGDRALFIANADPTSKVTIMTLLKQSSVLFSILFGRLVFREKHTGFRFLCALIVVGGILIAVI